MRRILERRLAFEAVQNRQMDRFFAAVLTCDHAAMDYEQACINACESMITALDREMANGMA